MATPFVRGMTFTSRVATADINSLKFQRRAEIPKSVMAKPFVRGYGEGGNPAYPNRFQSPLIPLFGLYPSSSTFPKRERKRKVYLLGRRAYYHVYCKSFVTLQSPKAPPEFIPQGGRGVEGAVLSLDSSQRNPTLRFGFLVRNDNRFFIQSRRTRFCYF